jgi:hypothetical protein
LTTGQVTDIANGRMDYLFDGRPVGKR